MPVRSPRVIVLDSCRPSHLNSDSISGSMHILQRPTRMIATLGRRQSMITRWLEDQHRSSAQTCCSHSRILSRLSRRKRFDVEESRGSRRRPAATLHSLPLHGPQPARRPNQPSEKASFTLGQTPHSSPPIDEPVNAPTSIVLLRQCMPEARYPAPSSASVPAEDV